MSTTAHACSICLVDDEPHILRAMQRVLHIAGFGQSYAFTGWQSADAHLAVCATDVLVLDILMGDISGIQALDEARERWPSMAVVMATGVNECSRAVECMKKGASDYLLKPINGQVLIDTITSVVERNQGLPPRPTPLIASVNQPKVGHSFEECRKRVRSFHPSVVRQTFFATSSTNALARDVVDFLCRSEIYSNAAINARCTAEHLTTNTTYLSATVNAVFGIGFRTLLNTIRLAVLIEKLDTHGIGTLSMEGLAASVGFARAATFYSAFKMALGTTPSEYLSRTR